MENRSRQTLLRLALGAILVLGVLPQSQIHQHQASRAEENELELDSLRPLELLGRCVSRDDCREDQCIVLGMQRFSEPRCENLGGEGADCIMGARAENKTLAFPNKILECQHVYTLFCPCRAGLVCREAKCRRLSRRIIKQRGRVRELPFQRIRELDEPSSQP